MIIVDSSETRKGTTMPTLDGAIISDDLEARTGADFMVSPMDMPITTDALLEQHVKNGAIFIQRKHGRDLASSIGERMNTALSRMLAWGAIRPQCVLMFIGVMTCNRNDNAVINKQQTNKSYWSILGATQKWVDRGGSFVSLPRATVLQGWCDMRIRHMQEYRKKYVKEIWPAPPEVLAHDKFLQTLMPVFDGRVLLASIPGIGSKAANLLYETFDTDIAAALCWLTTPPKKTTTKIKGIGPKTFEAARKFLNLDRVMQLSLEVIPDEADWDAP